tara:strand:+ start:264 stop:497 length:234 start_codon:yes stop_codon:yes gene_type:complete
MAIKKRSQMSPRPIEIDLTGPEGNAFHLLALAEKLGRKLGYDKSKRERIYMEMTLTDYEGLIYTFDREFGLLVTLYR